MTRKVVIMKIKLVNLQNYLVRRKGMRRMLGYIKGYELRTVSKRMIGKPGFTALLGEAIRDKALSALESKGFAYALYNKKKECCAVLIFSIEDSGAGSTAVLTHSEIADGTETSLDEFISLVKRELDEFVMFGRVKRYVIDGEVTDTDKVKARERRRGVGMGWIVFGAVVGLATKNLGLGLSLILIGCAFSADSRSQESTEQEKRTNTSTEQKKGDDPNAAI